MPCTPVALVLNGGFNSLDSADPQHMLVIDVNTMVVLQVIPDTPVALVGVLHMDRFDLSGKPFVLLRSFTVLARDPAVVGCTGDA